MTGFDKPMKFDDCSLYFAGYCDDAASLPEIRNTYKLFSVTGGNGVVRTFNNECSVKSGDSFIILPYETFSITGTDGLPVGLNCLYFTSSSARFNETLGVIRHGELGSERILRDKNINESLNCIVSELDEEKVYFREIISLVCNRLMLYVMRGFYGRQDETERSSADTGISLCTSIINYIDNSVYDIKNLSEVADVLGYNYSYLSNLFRKTFGITLNKYFVAKKMHEAENQLLETRKSVSKIAQLLNYSSVYAFSKAFKEFYGDSPVNYRKNHK